MRYSKLLSAECVCVDYILLTFSLYLQIRNDPDKFADRVGDLCDVQWGWGTFLQLIQLPSAVLFPAWYCYQCVVWSK